MDKYDKWFIAVILIILLSLFMSYKISYAGDLFKPQNPPEVITKPDPVSQKLRGYILRDSESYQGTSYLILPAGVDGKTATVSGISFSPDGDFNGKDLFRGPLLKTLSSPLKIKVIDQYGVVWTASQGQSPTPPSNNTNNFHHYNPKAWHGAGSAIVLCNNSPDMDSCKINGRPMRKHHVKDKGRWPWSLYNSPGVDGTVECKKGSKVYIYEVKNNGNIQFGGCQ